MHTIDISNCIGEDDKIKNSNTGRESETWITRWCENTNDEKSDTNGEGEHNKLKRVGVRVVLDIDDS